MLDEFEFKTRVPVVQFIKRELGGAALRSPEPGDGSEELQRTLEAIAALQQAADIWD